MTIPDASIRGLHAEYFRRAVLRLYDESEAELDRDGLLRQLGRHGLRLPVNLASRSEMESQSGAIADVLLSLGVPRGCWEIGIDEDSSGMVLYVWYDEQLALRRSLKGRGWVRVSELEHGGWDHELLVDLERCDDLVRTRVSEH